MPTATKFATTINTNTTKSAPPTLGSALATIMTEMVTDAKRAAVLLAQHHRAFDGEPECQAVLSRIGSILHDAGVQIENVRDSMSPGVKTLLDTPRSLDIKHRAAV
jgi:hypothetical protein